jgi:hypothetical protein
MAAIVRASPKDHGAVSTHVSKHRETWGTRRGEVKVT